MRCINTIYFIRGLYHTHKRFIRYISCTYSTKQPATPVRVMHCLLSWCIDVCIVCNSNRWWPIIEKMIDAFSFTSSCTGTNRRKLTFYRDSVATYKDHGSLSTIFRNLPENTDQDSIVKVKPHWFDRQDPTDSGNNTLKL